MDPSSFVDCGVVALGEAKRLVTSLEQGCDTSERIERIRLLEEMQSVVAAAMAIETVAFAAQQRAEQVAAGVPSERVGRGVAAQVGLARRMSPHAAARYLGNAAVLATELPATFAQLATGAVPEWRALLVAQRTCWLSREDRAEVDRQIAPQLEQLGTRKTINRVNQLAYQLDPRGYLQHLRKAESERYVSLRPGLDGLARLTTVAPIAQAVAAYAALKADAATRVGVEDETRTQAQLMTDTSIERLTGQARASAVPVAVNLVMTDETFLNYGANPDEPAHTLDGDVIPAELARRLIDNALTASTPSAGGTDVGGQAGVFLRRLFTHPDTGRLAAMDSTARFFTANQTLFLKLRDQICRNPWCGAPIRHSDHTTPAADGGKTSTGNGQGLCEACNYAKQAPGWIHVAHPDGSIDTITPTGHRYQSRPPDPPGTTLPHAYECWLETELQQLLHTAA